MSATSKEFLQLREYIHASRELTGWITGAKVLALLSGAIDSGVIDALRTKRSAQQISDITNIDKQIIVDLCLALEFHGIVQKDGEYYQLTPDFALLSSPTAAIPLSNVVHHAGVMIRTLQTVAPSDVSYTTTSAEDILAMAEGAGISALSSSPHVGQESIALLMPEVEALWQGGAHHLEVGCGVGNALFGTVSTYPKVTAVGIEIDELTATEVERRARILGVIDRVELRRMDARELQDEGTFDTIQWSQFFFPTASRPVVLHAMHRALKPGGYLFMPWMGSVSNDMQPSRLQKLSIALHALRSGSASYLGYLNDVIGDTPKRRKVERRSAALNRLLFTRWGVPVLSVEDLESEIKSNGFAVIRSVHTPVSQFVLTRGLLLAQREIA